MPPRFEGLWLQQLSAPALSRADARELDAGRNSAAFALGVATSAALLFSIVSTIMGTSAISTGAIVEIPQPNLPFPKAKSNKTKWDKIRN